MAEACDERYLKWVNRGKLCVGKFIKWYDDPSLQGRAMMVLGPDGYRWIINNKFVTDITPEEFVLEKIKHG